MRIAPLARYDTRPCGVNVADDGAFARIDPDDLRHFAPDHGLVEGVAR